ncbi:MAG: hypothetical protein D6730_15395 [Bacteroidetes bacterium]|nr:MAG: hypothetical protein D6730_15395 [Bacteroidota bacterium]
MIDFFTHSDLLFYLAIPVSSAIVGWGTNVVALKMTFYPLEFIGIGPVGWQGIIPSRAGVMAGKAVDLLTKKLITIEERFEQIDPKRVAEEMEPRLILLTERIMEEALAHQAPLVWETAPSGLKKRIFKRAQADIPQVVESLMAEVKSNISELFDLRKMVVETLEKDKELLNQIFLKVGKAEFRFIERSGLYFGFLFGIVQMGLWYYYQAWWILPLAGLLIGYATNLLALKLIFHPLNPIRIGKWTIQGLFIKRQKEVAAAYAKIVAERILTSPNIFETMLKGPASERLIDIVQTHVRRAVDATAGMAKPLFLLSQGSKKYVTIKMEVANRFIEELPKSIKLIFGYAEEALDIRNTLESRMKALPPKDFVSFLRPVFQEDEWKLILVGAVLGMFAGFAQLFFLF